MTHSVSPLDSPSESGKKPKVRGLSDRVKAYLLTNFREGDWLPPELDLAAELGVTRYAVSKAFNELFSQGLVQREPGRGTRMVSGPESARRNPPDGLVAFICSELDSCLSVPLISALQAECAAAGLRLALRSTDHRASLETAALSELESSGFAGAIVIPDDMERSAQEINRLVSRRFPLVVLDRMPVGCVAPFVATDHFAGAKEIVTHLVGLGHQRIGHLTYEGAWHESSGVRLRHEGYIAALREAGINPEPQWVGSIPVKSQNDDPSPHTNAPTLDSYIATHKLLCAPNRPTAIFVVNDYLASGVIEAAINHGLSVPKDLSVAGFDHDLHMGPKNLSLTTIAHPVRRIASLAMQMLSQQLRGVFKGAGPQTLIPGTLIAGQSTAPLA